MSEQVLTLEGVMSIAKAEALHHQLEDLFRSAQDVEIVTKDLERVDTSILQSLVAFVRDMRANNLGVSWGEQSEVFVAAATTLGVKTELQV